MPVLRDDHARCRGCGHVHCLASPEPGDVVDDPIACLRCGGADLVADDASRVPAGATMAGIVVPDGWFPRRPDTAG